MSQRCIYYFPLLLLPFILFYYNTPSQASVKQTVTQTVTHRKRIVGVGDFHGDYPQAVRTLQLLQVIDEKHDWSGGNWTQFIHTVRRSLSYTLPLMQGLIQGLGRCSG